MATKSHATNKRRPASVKTAAATAATSSAAERKTLNLALQGGGAHGAFGWGVLDRLLEDGRIDFDGVCATSAGAINAVLLAHGLASGGADGARAALANFWREVAAESLWLNPFALNPWAKAINAMGEAALENSPALALAEAATRAFSPYQLNPLNFNPIRRLLKRYVDFDRLRAASPVKLFLCATNVETGKVRIFSGNDVSADAVLASSCLPTLFQAVRIDGEYFWDGGYVGNPAIYPLIYECACSDVLIVHLSPIVRRGLPRTPSEIMNRLQEVSFNSSLMREMRAIAFVTSLIERGKLDEKEARRMHIHSIRADEEMANLSATSKLNADWAFLCELHDRGRAHAEQWLGQHFDAIGVRSSVDLRTEFL